jgi:hypothetical protein
MLIHPTMFQISLADQFLVSMLLAVITLFVAFVMGG